MVVVQTRCGGGSSPNIASKYCSSEDEDGAALVFRSTERFGLTVEGYNRLMAELDHEQLLTRRRCCLLAVCTLQEALRLTMTSSSSQQQQASGIGDAVVSVLEAAESGLRSRFEQSPSSDSPDEDSGNTDNNAQQLLVAKHLGHGMEYLKLFSSSSSKKGVLNNSRGRTFSLTMKW